MSEGDDRIGSASVRVEQVVEYDVSKDSARYFAERRVFDRVNSYLDLMQSVSIQLITAHWETTNVHHFDNCTTILGYCSYPDKVLSKSEQIFLHVIGKRLERRRLFDSIESIISEEGGRRADQDQE
ncbi:MAG TPA: hypothetical protein VJH20_04645 [Candidatus Nanoarchaeia archaeon]|nr:hypothetical protein [Candidatus Nanoarchaeia archaeon]